MHPEWQGGAFKASPIKTSLEAILTQFFTELLLGDKNNLGKFFEIAFLPKNAIFPYY